MHLQIISKENLYRSITNIDDTDEDDVADAAALSADGSRWQFPVWWRSGGLSVWGGNHESLLLSHLRILQNRATWWGSSSSSSSRASIFLLHHLLLLFFLLQTSSRTRSRYLSFGFCSRTFFQTWVVGCWWTWAPDWERSCTGSVEPSR